MPMKKFEVNVGIAHPTWKYFRATAAVAKLLCILHRLENFIKAKSNCSLGIFKKQTSCPSAARENIVDRSQH